MLDLKAIRESPAWLEAALQARNASTAPVRQIQAFDEERRQLLSKVETLKALRNQVSKEIAQAKKNKADSEAKILEMQQVGDEIKELDAQVSQVEESLSSLLLTIPNVPHSSVPVGKDETQNTLVREWGTKPSLANPQAHWDLGPALDILDFETAGKVTGSRFCFYKNAGAKLERALINLMLDRHSERGYQEVLAPFIVNSDSLKGTGQLPKFGEDLFQLNHKDYYLIPTAEVPLTNYYREETIPEEQLPIKFVGYTPCFRAEAGAHGRDTRGLIRNHQFNKVELVKFVHPDKSYEELESLVKDAEDILQILNLPYRVVTLCSGDLGFSAAKTFDIEVWLPGQQAYREISSCSNFEDFQARRAYIRYRPGDGGKSRFLHTLNGSGLAVGRTVVAILENYQQPDGSVLVPEALRPYMGMDVIKK
jgi:seryl-tRNA synthetase